MKLKLKFSLITPFNLSYWWNLGSLLGLIVVLQVITGFLLTIYYENSSNSFFRLWNIHIEVINGSYFHYLHLNFASYIFIVLYLHILKGIIFSSFLNLKIVWLTGWILIIIIIIVAFLGYVLPWGQIRLWGATVITNLLSTLPYGNRIVKWIWSGYFVSVFTIKLFFSLHFLVPLIILVIIIIHIIFLHYKGSSNSLGSISILIKEEFVPVFIWKDIINFTIFIFLVFIRLIKPYFWGEPENFNIANSLISPIHIQPEWYFLQYYAILRAITNKVGGVLIFVISLVFIIGIIVKKSYYRFCLLKHWWFIVRVYVTLNLLLIWLGGSPVESPYFELSQIIRILYFYDF